MRMRSSQSDEVLLGRRRLDLLPTGRCDRLWPALIAVVQTRLGPADGPGLHG